MPFKKIINKATGAEIDTGTDDEKFATALAIKNSKNVPNVVPSTAGKVMTSDGIDWISAAAGGGFDPTTTVEIYEDFVSGSTEDGEIGALGWRLSLGVGESVWGTSGTLGKIGVVRIEAGTTNLNSGRIDLASGNGVNIIAGNQGNITFIMNVANVSAAEAYHEYRFGLIKIGLTTGEPERGIFFRALGTGAWFAVTRSNNIETATDTTIAQSTTYRQFKIETNAAGTEVKFYIDGILRATHTTNITTDPILPSIGVAVNGGTTTNIAALNIDYMYLKVTGLTR